MMPAKLVLVTALVVGMASATGPPGTPGPAPPCGSGREAPPADSAAARGRGLAAVDGDRLVMIGSRGERSLHDLAGAGRGMLRHAASLPGAGTAFVDDRPGPDVLNVVTTERARRIPGRGEVTHPAWSPGGDLAWAVDLSTLEVWSPASGVRRMVPSPPGASGVFSPVFTGARALVAGASQQVGQVHDDVLNDLWRYDFDAERWAQLTHFEADEDRWSVVRTPVLAPDGSVLFVRVHGRASATELPSFELWALRGDEASEVRDLPGEMYLAGHLDGLLVWNVFDPASGVWRLVAERPDGPEDLGCGAVSVDPRDAPDPDLLDDPADAGQAEGAPPAPGSAEPGAGLALLVGDLPTQEEAASLLPRVDAPGAMVVDHATAPAALRPGAWAVVVPVAPQMEPENALAAFRARHPHLAERTWIVPFAPAEGRTR